MTTIKQLGEPTTETILAQNAEAIRALRSRIVGDVAEIGCRLVKVKSIVGHGNWLSWLDHEFGWSADTAERFIRVHKFVDGLSNSASVRNLILNLPVSSVYLLAAPSTPDEAREAAIERAQNGERLSVKTVRNQIDQVRKKQTAEPAQAKGAFPIYGPCAGGRVVTERTSTKAKAKAADTPALAPQQTDPDHLIAQFATVVRSGGLNIARQIEVAYWPMLVERLREVVDEIEIEVERWPQEAHRLDEELPDIPACLRRT